MFCPDRDCLHFRRDTQLLPMCPLHWMEPNNVANQTHVMAPPCKSSCSVPLTCCGNRLPRETDTQACLVPGEERVTSHIKKSLRVSAKGDLKFFREQKPCKHLNLLCHPRAGLSKGNHLFLLPLSTATLTPTSLVKSKLQVLVAPQIWALSQSGASHPL